MCDPGSGSTRGQDGPTGPRRAEAAPHGRGFRGGGEAVPPAGRPAAPGAVRRAAGPPRGASPPPAMLAAAAAVAIVLGPWLGRHWHRLVWLALAAVGVTRVASGSALAADLVLALAIGAVVGGAMLMATGAPD